MWTDTTLQPVWMPTRVGVVRVISAPSPILPNDPSPQQYSSPARMPHEDQLPTSTQLQVVAAPIGTGRTWYGPRPVPSSPLKFAPQQYISPLRRPHTCSPP